MMKCLTNNLEVNYPCSPVCPLFGDCVAAFQKEQKQRVRTNADRIRTMSDEELADLLADDDRACPPVHGRCHSYVDSCIGCWREWLQKPAEDANGK